MSAKNRNSSKTRKKSESFSKLTNYFPYCDNVVMMTATSARDLEELHRIGKIGKGTRIVNYENLSSSHWNNGITGEQEFMEKWTDRMREIFGSDSKRRKTLFKDVFKSSLVKDAGRKNELVLIDSCKKWSDDIARWVGGDDTVDSIVEDGIIGLNIVMSRTRIEGDSRPFNHNVCIVPNDGYRSQNEEYSATRSMYIIANAVENASGGRLETVAMMNYWDDARSPMAYIVFRKTGAKVKCENQI